MKFRRKQRVEAGIDITPLIDVVFLMLIFFMVSTTFTREAHLQISLPEADATPAVDEKKKGKSALEKWLGEASGGDVTQALVITADAKTPHELVVRAMDAAGRLGFSRLSITTRLPQEGN